MGEYVRNLWYMAAWQEETDGVPMRTRTLLNEPWLIYKTQDGGYAMLLDRCPHRFAPLSRGKRDGDRIACGYHGLTFDRHGKCVLNPFSNVIPQNAVIPTQSVVARHGILWFWPGNPERADPATIPNFAFPDDPTPMARKKTWMNASYELTDYLMDLSHVEFIHADSFQSGGATLKATNRAYMDNDGAIWSCRSVNNVAPPRFAPSWFLGQLADRWTNMRWNAPACMYLESHRKHRRPLITSTIVFREWKARLFRAAYSTRKTGRCWKRFNSA